MSYKDKYNPKDNYKCINHEFSPFLKLVIFFCFPVLKGVHRIGHIFDHSPYKIFYPLGSDG